ncbi:MAG: hypothetical protein JO333_00755, partial [Verrucomicrobia bacterium]|nr:hypothetical protein [Verrucomicrobiota bacterium]
MGHTVSTTKNGGELDTLEPVTKPIIAAWILTGMALIGIPLLHLVSALVAGLLVYELVSLLAPIIE